MRRFAIILLASLTVFVIPHHASAFAEQAFKTKYATILYENEQEMSDFIWRLGGQRLDPVSETELTSHRVDRIIERVKAILDMRPHHFTVSIKLTGTLPAAQRIAYYDIKTKMILIAVPYASDGVVAHEMAHAVICQYFDEPPPSKIQEILTQYVDRSLWSDY